MEKFRKISALMPALVLVGMCATAVLAVTDTFTEEYYGNELTLTRTVNQYNVSGTTMVEGDGGMMRRAALNEQRR